MRFEKLILIRHGENIYDSNLDNNNLPLSEYGIMQAKKAASILNDDFDIIYCSNSLRAIQTANIINRNNKKIIVDNRLIEIGWWNNYNGNEPVEVSTERIASFFNDISQSEESKVLIVTHGSFIKRAQNIIENKDIERERVYNCSILYIQG